MSTRDWDIFGPAGPLRRELERFASSLLSDREAADQDDVWAPAVDIYEREDSLVLLVDLPGLERDDIDLQVDANSLTIQGARSRTAPVGGIRLERPAGRFRRSFRIAISIDPAGVRASYRAGVLEVQLPKAAPTGPARVTIEAG
jgi:HSP20 family protein